MIGKGDTGPVIGKLRQSFEMRADSARVVGQQQREIVSRMKALVRRQVTAGTFELFRELAKHEAVLKGVHPAADYIQKRLVFLQVGVVKMALHVGGGGPF